MKKVFIDSDILLNIFLQRNEFYKPAYKLLYLADLNIIKAATTPLVFSSIFYILRRHTSKNIAIKTLRTIESVVDVITVNPKSVALSLDSKFNYFEDALQYYSCIEENVQYIITRNNRDFKHSKIPVLSARQFIILYQNNSSNKLC